MSAVVRSGRRSAAIAALALCTAACGDSAAFEDRLYASAAADAGREPTPDAGTAGRAGTGSEQPSDPETPVCIPAVASDLLPARSSVMERRGAAAAPAGVFTVDLFGLFQSNCGGCHVDNKLGGLQVTLQTFAERITARALDRIRADDPEFYMPPAGAGGKPFSERSADDPIVELSTLLEAWLAAGSPADVFYPAGAGAGTAAPSYLLSEAVGTHMTNLGNCIPPKQMVGKQTERGIELDRMFADASELPERLEQTDLVTLDAEALAREGVVAFAPAYTLWADNAKKIRMVRVPMGESIAFDPRTQRFDIPANTRFYKTFLKRVIDARGNESYRKMETRLIVARPDEMLPDGSYRATALFGTYAWNDDETEAVLVRDPLRNGKPFRDRLITYVTDEQAAEDIITTGPSDLQQALRDAGVARTYAIPGSERCIQCHMGSPMQDFVLGFSPLQLLRRPIGEGGVIEPAERDELNQLQRLIDYGVITGMSSPDEVTLLENSQGERTPRNRHELDAQGYMVGNCAHCHNPRGYPSRIAPELRDVLDFLPSEHGGIFRFPLEKFSPRIFRGVEQNVPQPYITPSLYDRGPSGSIENYAAKKIDSEPCIVCDPLRPWLDQRDLLAPWRSLIYRNVDTPFTYEEDFSIYPRMPMNTPGYDCRARQLLGSWMASIPSRLKPTGDDKFEMSDAISRDKGHPEAQPYEELQEGSDSYEREVRSAQKRVRDFEKSLRYSDCPDPSTDIVDPAVASGDSLVPRPFHSEWMNEDGVTFGYTLRAPERPHYAITDLTNPPGDWYPRRPDWSTVLVERNLDGIPAHVAQKLELLNDVRISEALRAVALTEVPFGLWQPRDGCNFTGVPKVADLAPEARPRWIDVLARSGLPTSDDAPVYFISPGAQVFTQICANCHGPEADSAGRLAATIADITAGKTRVANLRDGIFGPSDMPGKNRERVFGPVATDAVTAEDWAARYVVFMGVGGTTVTIPQPALDTIRNGTVLGESRVNPGRLIITDANMLAVPYALCEAALPAYTSSFVPANGDLDFTREAIHKSALIATNGDAELWRRLCAVDNEAVPVRLVSAELPPAGTTPLYTITAPFEGSLRRASGYPDGAPIGDQLGRVQTGIQPGNTAPWCIIRPGSEEVLAAVQAQWQAHAGAGSEPPLCPDAFIADTQNWFSADDGRRWATRGSMNAGLSVFLYLDQLARGEVQRPVPYNRCEQLPN